MKKRGVCQAYATVSSLYRYIVLIVDPVITPTPFHVLEELTALFRRAADNLDTKDYHRNNNRNMARYSSQNMPTQSYSEAVHLNLHDADSKMSLFPSFHFPEYSSANKISNHKEPDKLATHENTRNNMENSK
jgi:hypothetical protein